MGTFDQSVGPFDLATVTFQAEADIAQFDLVQFGTAQWQVLPCASHNSKLVVGVAQRAVSAGDNCPVRIIGASKVIAEDGNIAAGDVLVSGVTANNKVIKATANTNQNGVGIAWQASNAAGDEIVMLIQRLPGVTVS